nr:hypothetical protein [Tanacetum cinerariifolium]
MAMKLSPIRRQLTRNPSSRTSNTPPRVNAVQVPVVSAAKGKQGTWGNPQLALQDKEVIDSGCSRNRVTIKTMMCQPIDQNIDFSDSDQIQTPQYPDVHPPSQEKSEEVSQDKEDLINSIQTFLDKFNCIPFEERPKIYLQAWYNFLKFRHAKPEDSNELFQKLLEDLKELAEYDNSPSKDRPIFLNDNEEHSEGPPQDSDIRQLIREECCVEVSKEQKQNMEDTILELVKICRQKELLCMHDNVDDLIESDFSSKLLSINSQRLDEKKQEVKNVVEQPVECGNHSIESLQNFRVICKSSTFLKDTSQISSVHVVAPILSTKEPEHSLSMGYEHLSITPETKSDEVTESNAENLLPIPNEFKIYSNPLFDKDEINSDKLDPHCFNVESDFVESLLNRDTFIDSYSKFDFSGELAHVNPEITKADFDFEEEIHLIENLLEEINIVTETDDVLPPSVENDDDSLNDPLLEEADLFLSDNSIPPGIENFADDSEGDIHFLEELLIDDSILSHELSDSNFEDNLSIPRPPLEPPDAETDAGKEISVVINDIDEPNEDEFFDPGGEIVVSTKDDDMDYFPFMFVMQNFLPYLNHPEVSSLFLSTESEDTIFDPGISI